MVLFGSEDDVKISSYYMSGGLGPVEGQSKL